MEQVQEVTEPVVEPKPEDVGTRLDHLREYREALEAIVDICKNRGDKQRLAKFLTALEVITVTVDAFSGYNDNSTEYQMYRLLNSVPKKAEDVEGGRGTPLEC